MLKINKNTNDSRESLSYGQRKGGDTVIAIFGNFPEDDLLPFRLRSSNILCSRPWATTRWRPTPSGCTPRSRPTSASAAGTLARRRGWRSIRTRAAFSNPPTREADLHIASNKSVQHCKIFRFLNIFFFGGNEARSTTLFRISKGLTFFSSDLRCVVKTFTLGWERKYCLPVCQSYFVPETDKFSPCSGHLL